MSKDGNKVEKESKVGVIMPDRGSDTSAALSLSLAEDEFGPLTIEQRERKRAEREHNKKIFNNILKLKKMLLQVFNEEEWECIHSGVKFTFKNKKNPEEIIKVKKADTDVKFSGAPISKIIEAASRYEQKADYDIHFEIEAHTLEDAVAFMKDLHKNGFDIKKIHDFKLPSKTPYDINAIRAEILQKGKLKMSPKGKQKEEEPAVKPEKKAKPGAKRK